MLYNSVSVYQWLPMLIQTRHRRALKNHFESKGIKMSMHYSPHFPVREARLHRESCTIRSRNRNGTQATFKPCASVRFWRVVHIVTVIFVFFYIAFDVLDLDLSGFPLKQAPRDQVVVVTEVPKGTELASLLGDAGLRMEPSLLDQAVFKESNRLRYYYKDTLRTLRSTRYLHVHRLTFPRSSTRDSSPAA